MTFGLRGKLFLVASASILVLSAGAFVLLGRTVGAEVRASLEDDARARLLLVASELRPSVVSALGREDASGATLVEPIDRAVDDVADRARARVSCFDRAGVVVGDSAYDARAIVELGRSPLQPEVRAALQGEASLLARESSTQSATMLFAAQPIVQGGAVIGALRVGVDASDVERVEDVLARTVGLVAIAGIVAAWLLSSFAARLATQGIGELAVVARKLASGELDVHAEALGGDDLADLGRSVEQLAEGLRSSLKELVSERDLLSGVLTSMREGVLLIDRDGQVALINPALREMLLLGADAVGKRPLELVRDASFHELLDEARRVPGPTQSEIEVSGLKPRKLLVRAERLDVEPGALLVVFYDVTDLRRLETLRRDFVANASHELRTPVTSIRSAVETLTAIPPDHGAARERFLGILDRNAARLKQLVDDLLDLSRIESRELDLASEEIELHGMLEHVAESFAERAARSETELVVRVDDPDLLVCSDARALEQILQNLLDNALKYSAGARVEVRARAVDDDVVLEVEDTGPGIEPEHLPRLFERFYRVDPGRSRQLGGTGLGLSIVKHLAEALGGDVDVSSVVGRGTTFRVSLPGDRKRLSFESLPPGGSDVV